jgi:Ca2+-binding RTX toxin-like protein
MPILTPLGVDALVNTNTADGQLLPGVVALADGKYMVVWVGPVILPVVRVNGTYAPSYANSDIRAQIFNADGTPSGGEFIVNTTTAGGQLRVVVAELSDGHVLISWQDGVGPAGGEAVSNTILAQEFNGDGVATGTEFVLGNSNGRLHSTAPTPSGGFVVTYQEGGVGGSLPVGNIVTKVFDANNVQTSSFVVDNTPGPGTNLTWSAVEADGDIIVSWTDFSVSGSIPRISCFAANGTELSTRTFDSSTEITGVVALATGGHVLVGFGGAGFFAEMVSGDGTQIRHIEIAQTFDFLDFPVVAPLANGGFIVTWPVDSDPGPFENVEIMARAYNAIGNPIGEAFQLNTVTAGAQYLPWLTQLTNGDIAAVWLDESHLNGDASGSGINMRRIDFDAVNQNPTAADFTFSLYGVAPGTPTTEDPVNIEGFFGLEGIDADGDPLVLSGVSNVSNGTVTLNPDGTLTMTTAVGANGRLSFDYTVSDGQGGSATARATVTLPSDFLTIRVGDTALIDFLANDYYSPTPGATGFTVTQPGPVLGGTVQGRTELVSTASGLRIQYDPLGRSFGPSGVIDLGSSLFNLQVGQTAQYQFFYSNNETFGSVVVTLQGWAQLGGTGADNLTGTAQADHLSGGSGAANTLTGGLGNDWYTVAAVGDAVVELPNEGTDTVLTSLDTFALPDNVENLRFWFYGNSFALNQGYGNAQDNLIVGGSSYAELHGMGGNDTLIGGTSGNTFVGGAGADSLVGTLSTIDKASYFNSPGAVTINLATGSFTGGDAQGDTYYSIEGVIGSPFSDWITGSSANDFLEGGDGDDVLTGGGGNDNFDGGAGSSDEARYSGNRADYLIENIYSGGVAYVRITGQGVSAGDGIDFMRGIEFAQFADMRIRIGNQRPQLGSPVLPDQSVGDGMPFSYQIPSGSFIDPDAGDVLAYSAYLTNGSALPAWLTFDGSTRTFSGTPTLDAVGTVLQIVVKVTDNAPGDPLSQASDIFSLTIFQSPGPDISGTPGSDRLYGTFRVERMFGLNGDDVLIGSNGADLMDGGEGIDTVSYESASGVTVNLGTGLGISGQAAGDQYVSIENVLGSFLDDILIGNAGANTLTGGGGNDTLDGGEGDTDTAAFTGHRADYLIEKITVGGIAQIRVTGLNTLAWEGVDILTNIEFLKFSNTVIRADNNPPVLGSPTIPDQVAGDGVSYSYQIPATSFTDPDFGDVLTYDATLANGSALPAWLSFNPATRTFSGTPPFAVIGTVLQVKVIVADTSFALVSDVFALTIVQAPGPDVTGTVANDALNGTFRAERMFGLDGNDVLFGSDGSDTMDGGVGASDWADYSGSGSAVTVDLATGVGIGGTAAGDTYVAIENVRGSAFGDILIGNSGTNTLEGLAGIDTLNGGAGNDRLVVSAAGSGSNVNGGTNVDTLAILGAVSLGTVAGMEAIELSGGAALTLTGAQVSNGFALTTAVTGTGSLTINMSAGLLLPTKLWSIAAGIAVTINGTSGTDIMKLANAVQTVNGGDGSDQIKGGNQVDTINGGNGIDKIIGQGGADILTGGAGNDVFRYLAQGDSGLGINADRITDFTIGQDRLNFKDIDADAALAGDQAFAFLGSAAFTAPGTGQIRFQDSGADLLVLVDVNGDGAADMSVILQGLAGQVLSGADFVL